MQQRARAPRSAPAQAVAAGCATLCPDGAPRLDVLVNNAGVFLHQRSYTPEGVEMTLAVNHLGHFLSAPQSHDREAQRALYERSAQIAGAPPLPPA